MSYRDINAINQSALKCILKSPRSFLSAIRKQEEQKLDLIEEEEDHFTFGTVLDLLIKNKREVFKNNYIRVPDNIKITPAVQAIVKSVYKIVKEDDEKIKELKDYKKIIIQCCRDHSYYNNRKDDALYKEIVEKGSEGFQWLSKIEGKIPIKESDFSQALRCKETLKNDEFTKFYIDNTLDKNTEFKDDYVVQFEYNGIKIKGELDRIVIDHGNKFIYPVDFKFTSKPIDNFIKDFWYYRYDFQSATYYYGLKMDSYIRELIANGYILKDFRYIVVEKLLINNPRNFIIPESVRNIGMNGGRLSNGIELEGFDQAISRYKFHLENNKWEHPKEYYENNGNYNITI